MGDSKFTLIDLIDYYDEAKDHEIKTATKISNEYMKDRLFTWWDMSVELFDGDVVKKEVLDPLYNKCAISYINKIRTYITKVYNWGIKENLILFDNPTKEVKEYKEPDKIEEDIRFYLPDEWRLIENRMRNEAKRSTNFLTYYVIISIAYYTGMRPGEILALKFDDIIDDYKYIRINKTCTFVPKSRDEKGYKITSPKNKRSYRTILLPQVLIKLLKANINRKEKNQFTSGEFLFGGNRPIHISTVRKNFNRVIDFLDLKKIPLYNLRHSHVSMLINKGAITKAIAVRLGNTENEIERTYGKLFKTSEDACVRIIDEEFPSNYKKSNMSKKEYQILELLGYSSYEINTFVDKFRTDGSDFIEILRETSNKYFYTL